TNDTPLCIAVICGQAKIIEFLSKEDVKTIKPTITDFDDDYVPDNVLFAVKDINGMFYHPVIIFQKTCEVITKIAIYEGGTVLKIAEPKTKQCHVAESANKVARTQKKNRRKGKPQQKKTHVYSNGCTEKCYNKKDCKIHGETTDINNGTNHGKQIQQLEMSKHKLQDKSMSDTTYRQKLKNMPEYLESTRNKHARTTRVHGKEDQRSSDDVRMKNKTAKHTSSIKNANSAKIQSKVPQSKTKAQQRSNTLKIKEPEHIHDVHSSVRRRKITIKSTENQDQIKEKNYKTKKYSREMPENETKSVHTVQSMLCEDNPPSMDQQSSVVSSEVSTTMCASSTSGQDELQQISYTMQLDHHKTSTSAIKSNCANQSDTLQLPNNMFDPFKFLSTLHKRSSKTNSSKQTSISSTKEKNLTILQLDDITYGQFSRQDKKNQASKLRYNAGSKSSLNTDTSPVTPKPIHVTGGDESNYDVLDDHEGVSTTKAIHTNPPFSLQQKDGEEYKCHLCNKTYSSKRNRARHVKDVHQNTDSFKCSLCDKSFKTQQNRREHARVHEKSVLFHCEKCGNKYKRKKDLNISMFAQYLEYGDVSSGVDPAIKAVTLIDVLTTLNDSLCMVAELLRKKKAKIKHCLIRENMEEMIDKQDGQMKSDNLFFKGIFEEGNETWVHTETKEKEFVTTNVDIDGDLIEFER
uniref:Spindle pole body component 110-like n=1 Tax=Saccoglossus kowalevskii TaxID=10224 RepID=A0ABM0MXR6_SACKO